jgi:pseudaminic acid biosynthesis-associated methylase
VLERDVDHGRGTVGNVRHEGDDLSETERLEALWAGTFGDDYAVRNAAAGDGRRPFWEARLGRLGFGSALEVGCNVGANTRWLAELLGAANVAGVDVNEQALATAREAVPGADLRVASARSLPFADASFDIVFTTGVLIHQPPGELDQVMDEIVRCSSRYVLCGEYKAEALEEVPYRGLEGALFRNDYGRLYQERFPSLELVEDGFLARADGPWDDLTYWVFERR